MQPHDQEQNNFKRYRFGSFILDPQDTTPFRLLKDGQPCRIQRKQFELLVCLVRKHGQLISYDELFRDLWNHKPDSDPIVLESRIGKLQKQVSLLVLQVIGKNMIRAQKGFYCFIEPVVEEPAREEDQDAFKDLIFRWIINAREIRGFERFFGGFILFSALYLFVSWLGIKIPYLSSRVDPRLVLSVIQFIVIAYAFLASLFIFKQEERVFPQSAAKDRALMDACGYTDPDQWTEAKQSAKDSLDRYLFYWRLLVGTWTLLYISLIAGYAGLSGPVLKIFSTVFDLSNSLAIALCFVVLDQPTIFGTDGSATNLPGMTRRLKIYGIVTILLFVVVQVSVLLLEYSGPVSQHVREITFSTVDIITGLIGAVVMALLVGRIQTKFLGPSTWLPVVLYFYVTLPSLYAVSRNKSLIGETLTLEAAMILKCLLFLYVIWLFKSGRFLFYFVRVKKIYKTVNPDWKKFFLNLDRRVKS
jgi:hypothetical protein